MQNGKCKIWNVEAAPFPILHFAFVILHFSLFEFTPDLFPV